MFIALESTTTETLKGTAGAGHTYEQSAAGYDPSIGRVVIEQSNNGSYGTIKTGVVTLPGVKASPGFLKGVTIAGFGTVPAGTYLIIYDATTAAGTAILDQILVPAANTETKWIDEDCLFTTGLSFGLATVSADGVLTAVAAITAGTYSVGISCAYR